METNKCKLRADLLADKIAIQLNGEWFCEDTELEYNWRENDSDYVEVLYKGKWVEAESSDFDFIQYENSIDENKIEFRDKAQSYYNDFQHGLDISTYSKRLISLCMDYYPYLSNYDMQDIFDEIYY